ncbi:MAG TPA: DUF3187 family protein [Steroidobacter sp.]|jgi:hypothetical protein|nr:DUF3187 family protein [Steroidobacter sp.]
MRLDLLTFAISVAMLLATQAQADPFLTRDHNPLLAGFGLPAARPAAIAADREWSAAITFDWSSTALIQTSGAEALIVDAERKDVRIAVQRSLSDRIALRMEIPYVAISGGSLDGLIDDWHDLFGLPKGARRALPRDQLRIEYTRAGAGQFSFGAAASGLADIAVELGYSLASVAARPLSLWLSLEVPTGDAEKLTGNDALDASLILAGEHPIAERWRLYGQAAVTWLGEGGLLRDRQRSIVWSGVAGLSWGVAQPLELKAQLDAHTGALYSELDFLSDSAALTVGGALRFESWRLELGVSEDIAVERSPDVVFMLSVASRW